MEFFIEVNFSRMIRLIFCNCCEIKFLYVPFEKCSLLEGGNCCSPAVGCFDLHLPEKSFHPVKIQTPGQLR